jgi:hypothetical protein
MDKIILYSIGICHLSICAKKYTKKSDIEKFANAGHPTGIKSKWRISKNKSFKSGVPMPCQCTIHPDRKHWLLVC